MSLYQAYEDSYQGEKAVYLKAGRYEAVMLPELGGNMIAFRDTENGYRFLREPAEGQIEDFKENPGVYGIPVLFPPNRYEDGKFPWNGEVLEFPVNETATGNHLHGFLHTTAWEVEELGTTKQESYVTVKAVINDQHPVYKYLPFHFTFKLRYTLSDEGLSQQVYIKNNGSKLMPCLFAFHTAISAPFSEGSKPEDYRVKATIGKRWQLNERMLPTGEYQALNSFEEQLQSEGVYPFAEAMDNHYTMQSQQGRNRMELTDMRIGVTLVYDVGTSYKEWMIWNNNATPGFFCPEPQINLVNAPNTDLPGEEIGLFGLAEGEVWESVSRIYIKA